MFIIYVTKEIAFKYLFLFLQYVHSFWHIIIALSLIFVLPQKRIHDLRSLSIDELLDYKDYSQVPDLSFN